MTEAVDHDRLQHMLARCDAAADAAEAHGMLCGLACAGGRGRIDRRHLDEWLDAVLGEGVSGDVLAEECRTALAAVAGECAHMLASRDMEFYPLLPDDDHPLAERLAALREWSHGFLVGFTMARPGGLEGLPDDVREVVSDLLEFTRMAVGTEAGSEEDERAYTELVEYLKVAALLVCADMAGDSGPVLH